MKRLASLLAAGTAAFYAACAFAQQTVPQTGPERLGRGFGYGYRHMGGWGGGFMHHPFGSLFMVLLCVLVIALILRLFCYRRGWRGWGWHGHGFCGNGRDGRGALDILEEHLAKSEIDKNEFEEKRKLLGR